MLSYLVEQRTREVGARMALGASSQEVTQLMLAQTTRPVMYGLIAGAGCAAALAAAVIATPVGAYISQIVHVADPVAYLASLVVIVAACLFSGVDSRFAYCRQHSPLVASVAESRGAYSEIMEKRRDEVRAIIRS